MAKQDGIDKGIDLPGKPGKKEMKDTAFLGAFRCF